MEEREEVIVFRDTETISEEELMRDIQRDMEEEERRQKEKAKKSLQE